jgi:hypothetical protein
MLLAETAFDQMQQKQKEIAQTIDRKNCLYCGKLLMIMQTNFCSELCRQAHGKKHTTRTYTSVKTYRDRLNLPMDCNSCKKEISETDEFVTVFIGCKYSNTHKVEKLHNIYHLGCFKSLNNLTDKNGFTKSLFCCASNKR